MHSSRKETHPKYVHSHFQDTKMFTNSATFMYYLIFIEL